MNFDDLRAFVLLYQLKSFSTTAAELHMSQSTLSKRVHGIENELHIQLVNTSDRRNIQITEAGKHFYHRALSIIYDFDQLCQDMADLRDLNVGVLRIGAIPILGQYGITKMITMFGDMYPKLKLRVSEQEGVALLNQLASDSIDVAFLRSSQSDLLKNSAYAKVKLTTDQLVAVVAATNALAQDAQLTAGELRNHDVVSLLPGSGVYEPMMQFYHDAQMEPVVIFSSPHIETLLGMLPGTNRVNFLFQQSFAPFANSEVVAKQLVPAVHCDLLMVYKSSNKSKAITDFTDYIAKQFQGGKPVHPSFVGLLK